MALAAPMHAVDTTTIRPTPLADSIGSAPAKLILCGEHAVVYGRPAIALPLDGIRARARVRPGPPQSGVVVFASSLRRRWCVADDPNTPLNELILSTIGQLAPGPLPDLRISIRSSIPIASGMGSGAAVATAIVRALAGSFGQALPAAAVSSMVYASEQRFHGTPSGIDNTVIAFEQPIWYIRPPAVGDAARPAPIIQPASIAAPFTLLVGDTGVRSPTRAPVGEVRARWQASTTAYNCLFDEVALLAYRIRDCLAAGTISELGPLLSQNHALLQQIGVSSPELDALVAAAIRAGALGAKLSGAGWGGVMLALATPETAPRIAYALKAAGARRVFETMVAPYSGAPAPDTV